MKLMTRQLRNYAAKILQAADLLDDLDDVVTTPEMTPEPKPKRKPMSQAARNRIAKAQRKRWKLYHGGKRAA